MIKGYRLLLCAGVVLLTLFLFARSIAKSHIDKLVREEEAEKLNEADYNGQLDDKVIELAEQAKTLTPQK